MRVAVLGHTGFLGKNVLEVFSQAGVMCQGASKSQGVDLRDYEQVVEFLATSQPDIIINCAAHVGSFNYVTENASAVVVDNSRMTLSVYEAMAKVCPKATIIHPLANCAFPAKAEFFKEEEWQDGPVHQTVMPFASTRRLIWSVGQSFAISQGINSIYLLVPNMYGPHDSSDPNQTAVLDALISRFLTAQQTHQNEVTVWGTGVAIREWVFSRDLARLMLTIAATPRRPELREPINVAQNSGLSVRELVDIIQSALGFTGQVRWDHSRPDGALKKVMDDTQFKKVFPEFQFTEFSDGIAATIAYYKSLIQFAE
ncbi:NAD-dependent epimerase/dehydratase family protein [Hymenobacter sediminicola]|uniref:NAD-dependent epimerase/dehydratase family protein n=1 Tax=Hymenobacter sediminicola TaxID=2761579 RepID=A0A7G7W532_9BACT|nr:NAD-dependent epimerase/dehydratase family protein [Hymenobacter sediminicola]QNH61475.1 NAD-dependent epimerase/dehydratase family protein [Hymenobacter sediminicola]